MRFAARLATTMLVFLVISALFPEGFRVMNWLTALGAALLLSILNTIIKPIILILTLPLTIVTFGLFTIVINAMMLEMTASLIGGFDFAGFGWAILTAIVLSIVNSILTTDVYMNSGR
ncbi:phage holin family protein [Leuconostoc palmae]|uniref:phage holin family protein n=1 Tax=Leuconostoc palmae TaxID=501487 RepID=UPI001C7DA9EF|nr:phage holin family protein [Leuconostoc palmae]